MIVVFGKISPCIFPTVVGSGDYLFCRLPLMSWYREKNTTQAKKPMYRLRVVQGIVHFEPTPGTVPLSYAFLLSTVLVSLRLTVLKLKFCFGRYHLVL